MSQVDKKDIKGIILVGDGGELSTFFAKSPHLGNVMGMFCSLSARLPDGVNRLGDVDEVPVFLSRNPRVRRIYCSMSRVSAESVRRIQCACKIRGVRFCAVLPVVNDLEGEFVPMKVGGKLLLTPKSEPLSKCHNRILKRTFDLLLVVLFMLTAFPFVYLYKAVVLKRQQSGPSFVFDTCSGPNGKVFRRVNFRGDKCSLARVFNVLTGKMSLIGPACYEVQDGNTDLQTKRMERSWVKPGMIGWAQLNNIEASKYLDADIWYMENWSLLLDVRILFKSMFK